MQVRATDRRGLHARRGAVRRVVAVTATAAAAATLLLIGPAGPAGATTRVQSDVQPTASTCQSDRLHPDGTTSGTIGTCGGIDITTSVKVGGVDVAPGTALAPGDQVTVSMVVNPEGGDSAMYAETVDGIRSHQYDSEALVRVGLPAQTGTTLSAPTGVTMSRTDLGSRGSGPLINCLAQNGQDSPRTDPTTAVALGAGPVGLNGMQAAVSGSTLTGRWTTMAADRCVTLLSNNGWYPGFSLEFTQTVTGLGATAQAPTWSLGALSLARKDVARSLTWGSSSPVALSLPAAPPPNQAPVADDQDLTTPFRTPLGLTLTASDPDGDDLTYAVETPPAHGTLSGAAPTLTYTPDATFTGQDQLTFSASDGEDTDTGTVAVTVAGPDGASYSSMTPCRVVDTRASGAGGAFGANQTRSFQVAGSGAGFAAQGGAAGGCGIPDGAVAVEVSISAVGPSGDGFARAWPAGTTLPNATFLNYRSGASITNTGTVPLAVGASTADLSVAAFGAGTHVVVDVQGYFFP